MGSYLHRDQKYLLLANILKANHNAAFIMCPSYIHQSSQDLATTTTTTTAIIMTSSRQHRNIHNKYSTTPTITRQYSIQAYAEITLLPRLWWNPNTIDLILFDCLLLSLRDFDQNDWEPISVRSIWSSQASFLVKALSQQECHAPTSAAISVNTRSPLLHVLFLHLQSSFKWSEANSGSNARRDKTLFPALKILSPNSLDNRRTGRSPTLQNKTISQVFNIGGGGR